MYTREDVQGKIALPNTTGWTSLLMTSFRDEMRERVVRVKAKQAEYDPEDFRTLRSAFDEEIRMYEECLACAEAAIGRLTHLAEQSADLGTDR